MGINEEGYLSKDYGDIEAIIIKNSHAHFQLLKKINKYSHKLKFQLNIHNDNIQEILASLLYVNLIDNLNSIYILTSKGLLTNSNIIMRSMLESAVKLKYISMKYENAQEIIMQSELDRLKLMNVILYNSESFSEEVRSGFSKKQRNKLKGETRDIPTNKPVSKLAELTNMEIYYNNVYRALNYDVHSSFASLEKRLEYNKNKEVERINWIEKPSDLKNCVELTLFTASSLILCGIECINDLFKLDNIPNDLLNELDKMKPKN